MKSLRERAEIALARRHLLDFTQYTFREYQVNWHHRVVAEYLDRWVSGDIKRLIILEPPRHGKSEQVSRRLPAYILGRDPDASIIACSYTADLAARFNRDVQRIMDSPEYQEVFPETKLFGTNVRTVVGDTYLRNSDIFEVVGRKGVYKNAGMGGAITGMGCLYGIIDDPIKNREEAESSTYRSKVYDWYASTFRTRLEKDARILIGMTRWHEDDLAGRLMLLAKLDPTADQWVVLSIPAIAEPDPTFSEDPREPGEALWRDKYSEEELATLKATVGSYNWEGMYQQRPSPPEGGIVKRAWWQYYQQAPDLANLDELIQSWDLSFKDTRAASYVVGQVWGRKGANKYLYDQVRARLDFPSTLSAISTLSAKWPRAKTKLIEDKANGPAVIDTLRQKLSGLIPVQPEGSKEARVHAVSPDIEAGNVFLPENAPWVHDFVEEWSAFPNSTHDDQVDAGSQALRRLTSREQIRLVTYSERQAISPY